MAQGEAGRHVGGVNARYNAGMSLLDLCATHYGLAGYSLRPLAGGLTGHTHLLEYPGAPPLVLRVETVGLGGMPANERALLALEEQGYPAPRVVRTRDGSAAVQIDGMTLVVTTFIEGRPVESEANTPESLYGIGRAIGRLHALSLPALPKADFMSTERVVHAQARLLSVEARTPPGHASSRRDPPATRGDSQLFRDGRSPHPQRLPSRERDPASRWRDRAHRLGRRRTRPSRS